MHAVMKITGFIYGHEFAGVGRSVRNRRTMEQTLDALARAVES